ncbi:MAG: glycosyl transferase [Actinobacteria bacterium]|nr:glycosyl transferase [Actinomycetota bacterium]
MLALGRALRGRGHDVTIQTWERWRADAEREGLGFAAAPEYDVFPTQGRHLRPYEAALRAARDTAPLIEELRPDAVVADILTLAPALAAEVAGVRVATLIPHVDPRPSPGFPPYSLGARLPRTAIGRALWRTLDPLVLRGVEQGRRELDETRTRLGLGPSGRVHGGISRTLALVGTFPQLEYPRAQRDAGTHVIGPLLWEPPTTPVELPPGDVPLVLVAPSTAQDAQHRLLRAAVEGLADRDDLRVLATWNDRPLPAPVETPATMRLVPWLSYAAVMPLCAAVVCHGGHGTLVRALASGAVPVCAPAGGDMAENAARVAWAGAGVRIPRRLTGPRAVRLGVLRALGSPGYAQRARELRHWALEHDPGSTASALVERWAST